MLEQSTSHYLNYSEVRRVVMQLAVNQSTKVNRRFDPYPRSHLNLKEFKMADDKIKNAGDKAHQVVDEVEQTAGILATLIAQLKAVLAQILALFGKGK